MTYKSPKLEEEKLEWLKSIGAINIEKFDFMIPGTGHLYSLDYLNSKSLNEIKFEYAFFYSKRCHNETL